MSVVNERENKLWLAEWMYLNFWKTKGIECFEEAIKYDGTRIIVRSVWKG